jgi:hypothetical protein
MNTPTLNDLRAAYKAADESTRKVLEDLYGASIKDDIRDRIKLPGDAFRELGIDYNDARATGSPSELGNGLVAFHRLQVIAKALNEGWAPDWSDEDQQKWFPWFDFRGGRFVFDDVFCFFTDSDLGSRLCFRTRELAEYAGKQFEDLYNRFLSL